LWPPGSGGWISDLFSRELVYALGMVGMIFGVPVRPLRPRVEQEVRQRARVEKTAAYEPGASGRPFRRCQRGVAP
ncbi:MAG: hypothetical protein ACREKB_10785, partial [Candidatus Rokuibacteriota bacterium]